MKWQPIPGYAPYEASDAGEVRSPRGILAQRRDDKGRPRVNLSCAGRRATMHVSVLVALAFIPDRQPGQIAEHRDGDHANNNLGNLRWASQSANARNRHRTIAASGVVGLDYIESNSLRPWRARTTTRDRQRIVRSFADKQVAEAWLRDIRAAHFHD